jgi:CheY-like chemotaxis protein
MSGEVILIAEDNPLNRKLVEAVLRPHGYRLLIAVDGLEAIAIATRERPDLILMDLQLPKLGGYEAVQALRSQPETAHIPIVALTAHAMAGERERATAAGCDGYITKPIDTRALPKQVRAYLDSRKGGKSNAPDKTNVE